MEKVIDDTKLFDLLSEITQMNYDIVNLKNQAMQAEMKLRKILHDLGYDEGDIGGPNDTTTIHQKA